MKNQQKKALLKKQPMFALSLAVFILIISCGYFYYQYEKKSIRQEQYSNLKTIADLKTNQITKWREERLADAHAIAESPFIRQNFQRWLHSQDSTLRKDLLERFSLLRYNYKYEDVFVVSPKGNLLLDLNANLQHVDTETIDYCKKALQEKKTFLSDFYISPAHHTIRFGVFAPILNDRNVPIAILVLRINPYDYLYPLIQSWPISSKSAETLIVRQEGDSVLFLNELRHMSNTALKLRIPLTSIQVPAIQAVLGQVGIGEGSDYRGVKVLSDRRPIPGSLWFMIAKVDQSEIFAELKYRTVVVIIIALLLFLFSGIGISWLYNNQQKNIYRKLLETGMALEESQIEFRTTLYSIGDAVITTDINGCIRNMNVVAEKLTGWRESDCIGRSILEVFQIINEESGDKFESPVQRVLKEGLVVGLANHTLLISKDGNKIPIADNGAPILNEKGDITGVVLVFRDQTQERSAQKTLQESERKFRETVKYLDEGYYSVTTDGLLLDHNQAFNRILGFDIAKDMKGLKLPDFWQNPDDRKAYVEELMTTGAIMNYLINAKKSDSEKLVVLTNSHIVKDEEGRMVRIEGTFTDFTDRILAEEEIRKLNTELEERVTKRTVLLEASNKELEAFSYSVSHDLRAPLRHVSGYVELLNKHFQSDLSEKGRHYLNSISDSVRLMGLLIDDLLQFSRTGRIEMHQADIDMNEIVKEVIESLRKDDPDRKIEWVPGKLPSIYGDEAMIRLVWMNLLSNAVKFTRTRKKARIEIGSRKENEELVFYVRDNGVGFDMQYAKKLFGVFQRLHPTEEFEGTGIGLANVRRIVLRHGGRTWAEAEPDKGAVFYFSIPKK